jgi:hypothetical protein
MLSEKTNLDVISGTKQSGKQYLFLALGILFGIILSCGYFFSYSYQQNTHVNVLETKIATNEATLDKSVEVSAVDTDTSLTIEFLSDSQAKLSSQNGSVSFEVPILKNWIFLEGNTMYKHSDVYSGVNFTINNKDAHKYNLNSYAEFFMKTVPDVSVVNSTDISVVVNVPDENFSYYAPTYKSEMRTYKASYLEFNSSTINPFTVVLLETDEYFITLGELWKISGEVTLPENKDQADAKQIINTAINSITITEQPKD